jgi:hypothetical protein
VVGCCEHGNEHLGYTEGSEFLGQLTICQFMKKDSTPYVVGVLCYAAQTVK